MIEIGSRVEVLSSVYPELIGLRGTVIELDPSDACAVRFDTTDPLVSKRYDAIENSARWFGIGRLQEVNDVNISQEELFAVIFHG